MSHSGIQIVRRRPARGAPLSQILGISTCEDTTLAHLPWHIVIPTAAMLILAIALCRRESRPRPATDGAPSTDDLARSGAVGN